MTLRPRYPDRRSSADAGRGHGECRTRIGTSLRHADAATAFPSARDGLTAPAVTLVPRSGAPSESAWPARLGFSCLTAWIGGPPHATRLLAISTNVQVGVQKFGGFRAIRVPVATAKEGLQG